MMSWRGHRGPLDWPEIAWVLRRSSSLALILLHPLPKQFPVWPGWRGSHIIHPVLKACLPLMTEKLWQHWSETVPLLQVTCNQNPWLMCFLLLFVIGERCQLPHKINCVVEAWEIGKTQPEKLGRSLDNTTDEISLNLVFGWWITCSCSLVFILERLWLYSISPGWHWYMRSLPW